MKKLLTVGTNKISTELFCPVMDYHTNENIKPFGGLWLTDYINASNNAWVNYLTDNPTVLFWKYKDFHCFKIPYSLVTLKDSANIFHLDSTEKLDFLIKNYSDGKGFFSYEKLSKDYDGITIKTISDVPNHLFHAFIRFGPQSTILFNPSCILYYQSAQLEIQEFDIDYVEKDQVVPYQISVSEERKVITQNEKAYQQLYEVIKDYISFFYKNALYEEQDKLEAREKVYNSVQQIFSLPLTNLAKDMEVNQEQMTLTLVQKSLLR